MTQVCFFFFFSSKTFEEYMRTARGFVCVFDLTSQESFEDVPFFKDNILSFRGEGLYCHYFGEPLKILPKINIGLRYLDWYVSLYVYV